MSEYIEREAAANKFECYRKECEEAEDNAAAQVFEGCVTELKDIPAADVAPVVHGRWREDTDPADGDLRCTHCGIAWPKCVQKQIEEQGIWTLQTLFKYCPNCGAKMDKEAENERND